MDSFKRVLGSIFLLFSVWGVSMAQTVIYHDYSSMLDYKPTYWGNVDNSKLQFIDCSKEILGLKLNTAHVSSNQFKTVK